MAIVGSVDEKNPALMLSAAYVATQSIDGDRAETNLFVDWPEVRARGASARLARVASVRRACGACAECS